MRKPSQTAESPAEAAEAKAAFHLRLRARGIRDLAVLRAFEIVPRARFVPERHAALAARDLPLPIACGQTTYEPWRLAAMVEALGVEPGQRVLEIGSGSGYVTAVLAQIAGAVLGLERWASLAETAQARLDGLDCGKAAVMWADGLAAPSGIGRFDRVLVHGALPDGDDMSGLLAPGGRLVAARNGELVAIEEGGQRSLGPCPYAPLVPGLAGG